MIKVEKKRKQRKDKRNYYYNITFLGSQLFEEKGTYVFMWDNTYSYWNSKELSYKVQIQEIKEEAH